MLISSCSCCLAPVDWNYLSFCHCATLTEMQTERLALVAMYHTNISGDRLPFLLPVLLLHHPQLQHTLLFCQTFALFVQSNFLFLEDKWDKSSEWSYLISCMLLISAISNHNISYVSAKSGHYTLKTALFAWKTMNYLFKLSSKLSWCSTKDYCSGKTLLLLLLFYSFQPWDLELRLLRRN